MEQIHFDRPLAWSIRERVVRAHPEQIEKLVMLESLGPRSAEDASGVDKDMRAHVNCLLQTNSAPVSLGAAAYPDLNTAVEKRQATCSVSSFII